MDIIKGETNHQPRLDAWDKCSGLVHWDDPEGWDGEGGERGDWNAECLYTHGWFMSMYGKTHYNIVISLQLIKINEKKKRKKAREFHKNIYFCFIDYAKSLWLCGSQQTIEK